MEFLITPTVKPILNIVILLEKRKMTMKGMEQKQVQTFFTPLIKDISTDRNKRKR